MPFHGGEGEASQEAFHSEYNIIIAARRTMSPMAMMSSTAVSFQLDSWSIDYHPLHHRTESDSSLQLAQQQPHVEEGILLASIPLVELFGDAGGNYCGEAYGSFVYVKSSESAKPADHRDSSHVMVKAARVAVADYAIRMLTKLLSPTLSMRETGDSAHDSNSGVAITLLTMGQAKNYQSAAASMAPIQRRKPMRNKKEEVPFVLERSDCYVVDTKMEKTGSHEEGGDVAMLQFFLRVVCRSNVSATAMSLDNTDLETASNNDVATVQRRRQQQQQLQLSNSMQSILSTLQSQLSSRECFSHIASIVLQRQLRAMLQPPRPLRRGGYWHDTTSRNNNSSNVDTTATSTTASSSSSSLSTTTTTVSINNNTATYLDAVAFIADGSLLPRKSGRSIQPMSSPPAVPFYAPEGSEQLTKVVNVYVGPFWGKFLKEMVAMDQQQQQQKCESGNNNSEDDNALSSNTMTMITLRGMIIPRGVTLIVGGGYHGKSTILQALSYGVYDKVPGDGRELCVSHADTVSIRAEDGRYVHNVNVSAFINSIPSGKTINGASISSRTFDTTQFSTLDASGSTSQAANVIEALECRASALLVDEDVSAANFMARDGRMRAMIMDEPITPLLYRVNGLYLSKEHRTSTVVVVGGVGEWLDVADAVILMKNYVAYDGLKKARSVSYQFSYGHVQYAGRGVVHRLPWEVKEDKVVLREECHVDNDHDDDDDDVMDVNEKKKREATTLSPLRRRPLSDCVLRKFKDVSVHMPEGSSSRLWLYRDMSDNEKDHDEDDGIIDMSKCSQLVGNASEQLYSCGICILWLMKASLRHKHDDIFDLLDRLEDMLEHGGGMNAVFCSLLSESKEASGADDAVLAKEMLSNFLSSHMTLDLFETVGFCYHPRRHEVAMALTRMRGMKYEVLPEKANVESESSEEESIRLEEEARKKALADLWANRRKRGISSS